MSTTLAGMGIGTGVAIAALVAVIVTMLVAVARLSRSEGTDRDMGVFLATAGVAVLTGVIAMAYLVLTLLWVEDAGPPV